MNSAPSFHRRLFNSELAIAEKFRPIATLVMVIFSVAYAASFLGLMQYVAYLGPGLGDELNFRPFFYVFNIVYDAAGGHWLNPYLLGFTVLTIVNLIFSAGIIFAGYALYPRLVGKPFPLQILLTYLLLNAICTVGIWSVHGLVGLVGVGFGYDFWAGASAFGDLLNILREWANQVPTLIEMPAWLAFLTLQMVGGFFHYWFHRLAHESRTLWLLFHRTHHMTPELIQASTQAVFNAFPFFLFAAIPYVVIFTVVGKLVTSESLLMYLIVYKLISAFANLWSHQTALYQWAQSKWIIRVLSTITSEGVYHYLHHSAETEHNAKRGNLINIGGGLFFFWDRVFGSYRPVSGHRPRVGLEGIGAKEMSSNPMRLAFAGINQIIYELGHNLDFKSWLLILVGPSDYVPQHSKDFVLKEGLIR